MNQISLYMSDLKILQSLGIHAKVLFIKLQHIVINAYLLHYVSYHLYFTHVK